MGYGKYFLIWAWLIVLLVGGTFISSLPISKGGIVWLILTIALIKTALVALFYMHMKDERIPIWVVAITPFFLVALAIVPVLIALALA